MASLDQTKVTKGQSKPWRARVMVDYRHVDLGYHETWEKANKIELQFRECLSRWSQTGRWTGAGSKDFQRRYEEARTVKRRSQQASGTNGEK